MRLNFTVKLPILNVLSHIQVVYVRNLLDVADTVSFSQWKLSYSFLHFAQCNLDLFVTINHIVITITEVLIITEYQLTIFLMDLPIESKCFSQLANPT